jgi:ornithine decarboxylase
VGKALRGDQPWYYLDDGVYGMFSGRIYDHARYPLHVFRTGEKKPSAVVGPTCDSIDVIEEALPLPELAVGDLVIGRMMGAYTAATASTFNSLPIPRIVVLNEPS